MISMSAPTAARTAATACEADLRLRPVDPDLERAEPQLPKGERGLGPRACREPAGGRRVDGNLAQRAAQELRRRRILRLPGQVPQRGLQRPVAAGMEGDRLEHPDVALDVERVVPDEEVGVALEPVHRVAGADARQALVRVHVDERRLERVPRLRVPRGLEGRIEGEAQPPEADGRDPHERRKNGLAGSPLRPSSSSMAGRPSAPAARASRVASTLPE